MLCLRDWQGSFSSSYSNRSYPQGLQWPALWTQRCESAPASHAPKTQQKLQLSWKPRLWKVPFLRTWTFQHALVLNAGYALCFLPYFSPRASRRAKQTILSRMNDSQRTAHKGSVNGPAVTAVLKPGRSNRLSNTNYTQSVKIFYSLQSFKQKMKRGKKDHFCH